VELREKHGVGIGYSLQATVRGLASMREFAALSGRPASAAQAARDQRPRPREDEIVETPDGPMLKFAAAMRTLQEWGIPTAPFELVPAGAAGTALKVTLDGTFVLKLPDCAHPHDIGAVKAGAA